MNNTIFCENGEIMEQTQFISVSKDSIESALITAFEQGSSYWARIDWDDERTKIGSDRTSRGMDPIYNSFQKDWQMVFLDKETGEELGLLNLEGIKKNMHAFNTWCNDGRATYWRSFEDYGGDAIIADVALQFWIMGKSVYG